MTFLAAPLVAVLYLHASAFEVALVRAAQSLGALLFGLLAGATMEFMVWGLVPVGAVLGGVLATVTGTRATLGIAGAGACLAAVWLILSPVRTMRELPAITRT